MFQPSSVQNSFRSMILLLLIGGSLLQAQTTVLNDVNIINEYEKNAIILLTNNDPETFPYDQAYGLTNYWTKWDVLLNADNTYSFRLNNKYLSANADGGVNVANSIGTNEKFFLESGNGTYYIRTWRHTYLGANGSGWKDVIQSWERTSNEEWLFNERPDPTGGLDNINISNYITKNIIILLTNNDPETFPYDQAYGANNYWTKWDVIVNGDGTYSFHVNGKYLADTGTTNTQVISAITTESKWTLESADRGTYAIKSNSNRYLTGNGTGWKDVIMSSTLTDEGRWHFFDRQNVTTYTDTTLFIDSDTVGNIDENWATVDFVGDFDFTPALFANMQTFNGTDPADLRIRNLGVSDFDVFVQEEQSKDSETAHNNETIGFLALAEGGIRNTNGQVIAEAGIIDVTQDDAGEWFTLDSFIGTYSDPVVIMVINSYNGTHESHMRVRDVGTTSFRYQLEEWDFRDGTHGTESVAYLIVEAGTHSLEKGGTLQAQTQKLDHNAEVVTFPSSFSSTPVVLSQTQTRNGNASVNTRMYSVGTSSVTVRLQEQEADNGTHDDEWVGVVSYGN
ncbi:fascin domain-containing protein [Acanthopleuribacter pedis]|uniref:Uncharacterized protein n=1 Tax=Acanthopleuribacter pedis TaxID=442870 RepID=A0A8J7U356_9BACT|nr:hypothetical protein [Acanthopleuribacter pedis]MBO1319277.1 hypothetical protein [Acanthopleuribacter pedis]